jgi:hypothetical protein
MTDKLPFTIEILEFDDERPVVLDRVIGGSMYLEEAKRIGNICFPSLTREHDLTVIASSATITNWSILGRPVMATKAAPNEPDAYRDARPGRVG